MLRRRYRRRERCRSGGERRLSSQPHASPVQACRVCLSPGHNRRTCLGPAAAAVLPPAHETFASRVAKGDPYEAVQLARLEEERCWEEILRETFHHARRATGAVREHLAFLRGPIRDRR